MNIGVYSEVSSLKSNENIPIHKQWEVSINVECFTLQCTLYANRVSMNVYV